jgi:hypothetical protein
VIAVAEHARVAQVHVVPAEQAAVLGIGRLCKHADVLTQAPGQERGSLLQLGIVVGAEALGRGRGLVLLGMRVRLDQHRRKRNVGLVADLDGVAQQLELAPELGELRPEAAHVAGHARLPGLPGVRRHRRCQGGYPQPGERDQNDPAR